MPPGARFVQDQLARQRIAALAKQPDLAGIDRLPQRLAREREIERVLSDQQFPDFGQMPGERFQILVGTTDKRPGGSIVRLDRDAFCDPHILDHDRRRRGEGF